MHVAVVLLYGVFDVVYFLSIRNCCVVVALLFLSRSLPAEVAAVSALASGLMLS